jgi:signal peptidase II
LPFFGIAAAVLILDQLTKAVVAARFALHESVEIIPGLFSLTLVHNSGAAFGFLAEHGPWRLWFFLLTALAALVGITLFYLKSPEKGWLLLFGCSFIAGGAAGNLIDRIRFGYVVDFLDFYIDGLHWPAFNVADSAITVGTALLALYLLREEKEKKR